MFLLSACAPTYVPMKVKIRESTSKQPVQNAPVLVRQNQFFLPFPPYDTLPFSLTTFQRPGKTAHGTTDAEGGIAFSQVTSGPAQIIVFNERGQAQSFFADHAIPDTWVPMGGSVFPDVYEIQIITPASMPTTPQQQGASIKEAPALPLAEPAVTPTGW